MAKRVRFYETGGPEVLRIEEAPATGPGKGEAVLRVQAIGLNRAESMFMHGQYLEPTQLPAKLGYEAAGVVTAVGADVDKSMIGRKLSTMPAFSLNQYGVLGEEVVVPVHALAEYPDHLSPVEATSIWMQYLTAYGALIEFGKLKKGEFVIITAASSSAGLAAIETVKAEGGVAIATTRSRAKYDELLKLGADHVIVTDEENLVERVKEITSGVGARIVFDPIGGPMLDQLVEAAAQGATIFEYGALSKDRTPYPLFQSIVKGLNIRGYWLVEIMLDPERLTRAKSYVFEKLASKQFRPKVAKTFPFEQVVQAYQYLESNNQIGKVVVTVGK
ncbi:NADPH:quinone reductase-like Zn-dependent oxidoreductase [Silvibacterium bohemicum]|uniref:NADPH:quinone reductase-like Zn-dependent oxidoreductase n=1 Tax=Silvibacterium bohemicum TaxID=1577686 RepID=A0A841K0D7_9BACT|nr:zinc-dependent alcohol dehydrogenase family protein [Silvibacterium bohemicum]MBB6146425.1 NADPH:quinone reductase-like Zn-dependent oxidoreductase [Silvibacterium bohemicum]